MTTTNNLLINNKKQVFFSTSKKYRLIFVYVSLYSYVGNRYQLSIIFLAL